MDGWVDGRVDGLVGGWLGRVELDCENGRVRTQWWMGGCG